MREATVSDTSAVSSPKSQIQPRSPARCSPHENRKPSEETLFLHGEQVIAPLDGAAQSSLACRGIACTAGQEWQSVLQTCQECLWRKELDACCRQLDGQGKSIQARADLCHSWSVGIGHLEIWLDRLRPLNEYRDSLVLRRIPGQAGVWDQAAPVLARGTPARRAHAVPPDSWPVR